ncbi:MAG TPA: site-2 protease family protein [Solirubrobacteraceae bacterium]|jgi:Zn-dependent protease|nr:site-2 protease family protein [Solirubrobacteraceae bacterium]
MPARGSFQLMKISGIRVGASASWFFVLFILIYYLSAYFHEVLGGSHTTAYLVAVAGALGYFGSLILHELGHALVARHLGIPVIGIDLWFFGGVSHLRRETESSGEELKVAAAGPAVTLSLFALCFIAWTLLASTTSSAELALTREGSTTTPVLALVGWLGFINGVLFLFNILPAFPLDGGRIARAVIWWRTGDRHRGTRAIGRSGQGLAILIGVLGLLQLAHGEDFGVFTAILGVVLYQASGGAVVQGAIGQRIRDLTVGDVMDREPIALPAELRLLDAQEQFFLRYHLQWFAVVDPARHFLGVLRHDRVEREIAAGRPALQAVDVLEENLPVRIAEDQSLEAALRSEGLGRLGAMVAVDSEGVLRGVVTLAQIRRALRPAGV